MNSDRLEFDASVDGLFRGALGANEDLALAKALRDAGLDLSRKLPPAVPAHDFYRWMKIAASHRFPRMSEAEACAAVGELAVEKGLTSTLLGRALLQAIRVLGVRRSLLRIGRALRNGNNYIVANVVELGPLSIQIELEPVVAPPSYYEGVLRAGTMVLGARDVVVTTSAPVGEKVTYVVEWKE